MKYRKKSPEVDVWKMDSAEPKPDWVLLAFDLDVFRIGNYGDRVYIPVGKGYGTAWYGVDCILKDMDGNYSVVRKDVFERDYEEVR